MSDLDLDDLDRAAMRRTQRALSRVIQHDDDLVGAVGVTLTGAAASVFAALDLLDVYLKAFDVIAAHQEGGCDRAAACTLWDDVKHVFADSIETAADAADNAADIEELTSMLFTITQRAVMRGVTAEQVAAQFISNENAP